MSLRASIAALVPWAGLCAALALAAGIAAWALGSDALAIEPVPTSEGSLGEATTTVAANGRLAALVFLAAWLASLSERWRPPRRLLAGVPIALALANALVAGAVIGALGGRAFVRALPHAPLELAGFAFAFCALVWAFAGELTPRRFLALALAALVALAGAALAESFVSGEIA